MIPGGCVMPEDARMRNGRFFGAVVAGLLVCASASTAIGGLAFAEEGADAVQTAIDDGREQDSPVDLEELIRDENARTRLEVARLRREVLLLQQRLMRPGWREVVGGIGYIVGLFGVAFFIVGRLKKKSR